MKVIAPFHCVLSALSTGGDHERRARSAASLPEGTRRVLGGVAVRGAVRVRRPLRPAQDVARPQSANGAGDGSKINYVDEQPVESTRLQFSRRRASLSMCMREALWGCRLTDSLHLTFLLWLPSQCVFPTVRTAWSGTCADD